MPDRTFPGATPPDHRRYRVYLDLQADSPTEIERVLETLATDLFQSRARLESGSGRVVDVTSGGYSSGYALKIDLDEDMTGDRYRDELRAWAQANREQGAA